MTKTSAFLNSIQVLSDSETVDEDVTAWPEVTIEENGDVLTITFPEPQPVFV